MGDRSSVTFVTTEEGNERLIQECDKLNDERGITYPLLGSSIEPEELSHEEGCVIFGWPDIKWYSSYDTVKVVENAYNTIKELNFPADRLVIGVAWNDVEYENCSGDPRLPVHVQPRCEPVVVIEE